jgi:hypothetical protein
VTHLQHSDRRLFIASALLILSAICLFVSFYQIASTAVLRTHMLPIRLALIAVAGLALLGTACAVIRDISALWQIPLQAFAGGTLVVGVGVIVTTIFADWHLLYGSLGLRALSSLLLGLLAAWLMRRLQVRLLPQQDA